MKRFLIWILAAALLLCGCHPSDSRETFPDSPSAESDPIAEIPHETASVSSSGQLKGRAESQAEAEQIAQLYGITLVDFDGFDLALFSSDEDPEEVIRRGEENGWPQLTLNLNVNLH